MSTRTRIAPFYVLKGVDMTKNQMGVTILNSNTLASYDIAWTGLSPVGTITIQISNTYKLASDGQTVLVAGNWTAIPFINAAGSVVTSLAISGNSGTDFINCYGLACDAISIVFTPNTGTGTLTAVVTAKVA